MDLEKHINWELIENIFEQLENSIMIVNRGGVILYTNAAHERVFDMDRESFRKEYWGKSILAINTTKELLQVVETGKPLLNHPHVVEKIGIDLLSALFQSRTAILSQAPYT